MAERLHKVVEFRGGFLVFLLGVQLREFEPVRRNPMPLHGEVRHLQESRGAFDESMHVCRNSMPRRKSLGLAGAHTCDGDAFPPTLLGEVTKYPTTGKKTSRLWQT
jgi:hypothetical protein